MRQTKKLKITKAKIGRLVIVIWEDAYSDTRWHAADEVEESMLPRLVESVGFVKGFDKRGILLAHNHTTLKHFDVTFIPSGVIRSIKYLSQYPSLHSD